MSVPERRIRVMVVDDFPGMHLAVERLLSPSCEIVAAVSDEAHVVAEAVRALPDVIVLDLRMPGTSGLAICQRLITALPASRIVLYSANDDAAIKDLAVAAGALDFVPKDRIVDDLLPAIRRAFT